MLTKQEFEIAERLIDLSTKIKKSYYDLYQLEISTGKQTIEYKETILKIKQLLKIQEDIYLSLKKNANSNENILNYIISNYQCSLSDENFYNQLIQFDDSTIIMRIASKLSENSIYNLRKNGSNLEKKIFSAINDSIEVKRNVILDIIRCHLAVNENYINYSKDLDTKLILKKVKYVASFLYFELEEEFLKNNFEINNNPYISYRMFCQFMGVSKDIIEEVVIAYGVEFYANIVNLMLQYNDNNLNDYEVKAKLINEQCFLRAIFILLDDETIMSLNAILHDMIDDVDMQDSLKNKDKIVEMIINAYRKVKKDRSIPKIISLKL